MGVVPEGLDQILDVRVKHRMIANFLLPLRELGSGGQFAEDHEVRDLEEARVLRELLDGVTPVAQYPLFAVDIGDGASRRGGIRESGS